MKRIGVLTSGGDSQGMNAAVYATVRYAVDHGLEVYGIDLGYKGLIEGKVRKLSVTDVDDVIHRGGTILRTARCDEMKTQEGQRKAVQTLKDNGIDGLVVIGGDGSFNGAKALSTGFGVQTMGIPGTIDNDLAYTDFTLGFDTAVNVVMNTIKMLRDTMSCNDRSCIVEVMGRNCGDIALYAGITSAAEMILVPEIPFTVQQVVDRIKNNLDHGKMDNIIVLAEGAGKAEDLRAEVKKAIPGINIRSMTVGHLQRGGDASFQDRLLGVRMAAHAVQCLLDGKTNRVVGVRHNVIIDEDIVEALSERKSFNKELYALADQLVETF
ncbi:MAG TPA: 6-phosphofructokinase [Candidatus Fimimonas merdipullorum]|uniref:ATP-dependent 6-phosphofructokinase n=1 Tax=Candidatus Fimimonas merdipullorum TaxID=2840822 RepID=A0A9D1SPG8_9BACT|nr:6-phosphofructokinase [Candidatus Fimimonas merdipullorum]